MGENKKATAKGSLANRFQDLFDSIQDGDTTVALEDVKTLCRDLTGIEIEDERESGGQNEADDKNETA
jgi:hypothetical protein